MLNRRSFFVIAAIVACGLQTTAFASEAAFTAQNFAEAQKAGKPILIAVHADWCPTCKAQGPIIGQLKSQPKFKDLAILRVDFDAQKDVVRKFGAQMQSTLIVFKGDKEVGRSVGDTKPESIATLLDKAI